MMASFGLGFTHVSADTPYSFTYYFHPGPEAECGAGGYLSTNSSNIMEGMVFVGGPCPGDIMNTTYIGPDLTDVSVAYNITTGCEIPSTDYISWLGESLGGTPEFACDGYGSNSYTTAPSFTLDTGEAVNIYVGFNDPGPLL